MLQYWEQVDLREDGLVPYNKTMSVHHSPSAVVILSATCLSAG